MWPCLLPRQGAKHGCIGFCRASKRHSWCVRPLVQCLPVSVLAPFCCSEIWSHVFLNYVYVMNFGCKRPSLLLVLPSSRAKCGPTLVPLCEQLVLECLHACASFSPIFSCNKIQFMLHSNMVWTLHLARVFRFRSLSRFAVRSATWRTRLQSKR